MLSVLKSYLKRLTNLTSRNKSLLLLSATARQFVDIHELDFLNGKSSFALIEQLISRKNTIPLMPVQDSRHEKLNQMSQQLRHLQRTAKFIEDEAGTLDLYVGYPFVRGKFMDGSPVRCPLLFFPVNIKLENNAWKLTERDENVVINRSFLLAYSHFNQIKIPDALLEADFESFSPESLVFRTQLYEWLKATGLEINFNSDLLNTNQLIPFENYNSVRFEEKHKTGELKLFPEAVLGIFPQSGSFLAPDYEQLIEENSFDNLEEWFLSKTLSQTLPVKEENMFTPFQQDASQEKALRQIRQGQSLVVQGPPGTGKSQLIANLICDFTARGKKVLLVSHKRAALDVVYERLKQAGMQDFVAQVHDFRHDRKSLFEQINSQIEKTEEYKTRNQTLDAIYLDREFSQQSRRIDKTAHELEEFRKALFDTAECGRSVKELYLTSTLDAENISLRKEYKYFHFEVNVPDFLGKLQLYEKYAARTEAKNYAWRERVSFAGFSVEERNELVEMMENIPKTGIVFTEKTEKFSGKKWSFPKIVKLQEEKKHYLRWIKTFENETQWQIFLEMLSRNLPEKEKFNFAVSQKNIFSLLDREGVEKNLDATQLKDFENVLQQTISKRNSWVKWQYWKKFSADKPLLFKILGENQLTDSPEDLNRLLKKVQNRIKLEETLPELQNLLPVLQPFERAYWEHWFGNFHQASKAVSLAMKLKHIEPDSPLLQGSCLQAEQRIHKLFSLVEEAAALQKSWSRYLTDKQITQLLEGKADAENWVKVLKEDFEEIMETDRLRHSFSAVESQVLEKLQEKTRKSGLVSLTNFFENSLRLAWIEHIEEKYPVLKSVSTPKMEQLETELQEAIRQKTKLSQHILLMRLRENVFREQTFNRLHNPVTYRELKHQVSKKRSLWSVRQVMQAHAEAVFRLVPCWMASPETVSAVFPLHNGDKPLFDLVLFDEASQCFAETGIPAIFRGNQVVISGDSQQLPPNDLYHVRFEEETENPDLETESLLDLAVRYLPQTQLQGHYRSQSLELIDFSNRHFYKNSLQLLPDHSQVNALDPPVQFEKVAGIWAEGVNETEAEKVVEIIRQLLKNKPQSEIGVVTFNFKQQNLIQDKLEAWAMEQPISLPESLFVKNIENVQGDERDIIIFSIGYAPDAKGKITLQFGSLNLPGGENRLNVAVTRARQKIFVVSSLLPQQLHTENTLHEGPKLLKKYLEYSLSVSQKTYQPQPVLTQALSGQNLLKDKLALWQENLKPQLPFADLTLQKNGNYGTLVLTDDDLYFQSLSAKEAHAYRIFMLTQKNWNFEKFYSRQFWKNSQKLKERLKGLDS
jgi:AAA domain/Protein of unknown function (DUF4011)